MKKVCVISITINIVLIVLLILSQKKVHEIEGKIPMYNVNSVVENSFGDLLILGKKLDYKEVILLIDKVYFINTRNQEYGHINIKFDNIDYELKTEESFKQLSEKMEENKKYELSNFIYDKEDGHIANININEVEK